ncbi:WD40 repeat-like protein [Aspergillus ellipticus CBS 707.79]|uniref:WD40 repeat-like protein n=1 Tax=Aspergillus ellipticus CBS 707.79 TaxID=1448320 RepID=A0A319CSV0_9EURO|nr:WD40 repeat-like protein [Aspergillus ellipticus CBS 707.79]
MMGPPSHRESSAVSAATAPMAPSESFGFPQFQRLHPELRLKIWQHALEHGRPRRIKVEVHHYLGHCERYCGLESSVEPFCGNPAHRGDPHASHSAYYMTSLYFMQDSYSHKNAYRISETPTAISLVCREAREAVLLTYPRTVRVGRLSPFEPLGGGVIAQVNTYRDLRYNPKVDILDLRIMGPCEYRTTLTEFDPQLGVENFADDPETVRLSRGVPRSFKYENAKEALRAFETVVLRLSDCDWECTDMQKENGGVHVCQREYAEILSFMSSVRQVIIYPWFYKGGDEAINFATAVEQGDIMVLDGDPMGLCDASTYPENVLITKANMTGILADASLPIVEDNGWMPQARKLPRFAFSMPATDSASERTSMSSTSSSPRMSYCVTAVRAPSTDPVLERVDEIPEPQDWSVVSQTLEGHTGSIRALAFTKQGRVLASASYDGTVSLWDLATKQCLRTVGEASLARCVNSITFVENDTILVTAETGCIARFWDPATGQCLQTLSCYTDIPSAVVLVEGRMLLSACYDSQVQLWDPSTSQCIQTLTGHACPVRAITSTADGKILASCSSDSTVQLWNPVTGERLHRLTGHTGSTTAITFSSDSRILASSSNDATVRLWDPHTGKCLHVLEGHTKTITSVHFSPDDSILVSASHDCTVRLWDPLSGKCLQVLRGHRGWVKSLAFTQNSRVLATGSSDRNVQLWDVNTGHCLQTLKGHSGCVADIIFSPDGSLMATGSWDNTVRLWDFGKNLCPAASGGRAVK